MANLLEYVGNVHIFLGPYRGNPIALYLKQGTKGCEIAPRVYPWNDVVGKGETPNRAAADFEEKWKTKGLSPEMYSGPAWQGVKPEKPAPPKPPVAAKPAAPPAAGAGAEPKPTVTAPPPKPERTTGAEPKAVPPKQDGSATPAAPAHQDAAPAKPATPPPAAPDTKAPVTTGESNSPKGQSS